MRCAYPSSSASYTSLHPFARFYQELLFLPTENTNPDDFVGPECDLPSTAGTTPHCTVVTEVADSVSKLGLQTHLAGRLQLHPGLLLDLRLLLDLLLQQQDLHLLLLEELGLLVLLRLVFLNDSLND